MEVSLFDANGSPLREEADVALLAQLFHVLLDARAVADISLVDVYQEVEVRVDVVVLVDVLVPAFSLEVQTLPTQSADEALLFDVFLQVLLSLAHLGDCIDDRSCDD